MTLQAPITHVPSAAVRSPPSSAPSYWGRLFVVLIVVCFEVAKALTGRAY